VTPTEEKIAEIMTHHGGRLPLVEIRAETAMAQDALIEGLDVDDFVRDLAQEFGDFVREFPWARFSDQRASFRGCIQIASVPIWLLVRLVHRRPGEPVIPVVDSSGLPRLTLGHIAKVIDEGCWSEPPAS
jgi:hypothetical protein